VRAELSCPYVTGAASASDRVTGEGRPLVEPGALGSALELEGQRMNFSLLTEFVSS